MTCQSWTMLARRGWKLSPMVRRSLVRPTVYMAQQQQQQVQQHWCRWNGTLSLDHHHRQDSTRTHHHQHDHDDMPPKSPPVLKVPDFGDAKAAYQSKSTWELVRAMVVFQLCRIPILVEHSETLLKWQRQWLGPTLSDALLKATLFGHFCAGVNEEQMKPVLQKLQSKGIGSILDYAAEDDGSSSSTPSPSTSTSTSTETTMIPPPKVRVYDYTSEQQCDRHVETFKKCIRSVKNLNADGYAAIKITALGQPKLLEKMSKVLREVKNLFAKFDVDHDGIISRQEFEQGYQTFFKEDLHGADRDEMYQILDPSHTGRVDFITWSMMLTPMDMPKLTAKCKEIGPLASVSPTEEEIELMQAMFQRGRQLAQEATTCGTRLLIDAEQYRFQPAIDNLVLDLQRTYNAIDTIDKPIIYHTYQCYLKDTPERIRMDMERSQRHGYHFGAKLVRGAYMEGERALAKSLGFESPIHDTIQDTHQCYNDSVEFLLRQSMLQQQQEETALDSNQRYRRKVELMLASHNQESIEKAIDIMAELQMDPQDSTISFAQLYGMADNLTFNLGQNGFRAYKYVPYGQVGEVMPYLVRRARENSSIQGGAARELQMIRTELKRRMVG